MTQGRTTGLLQAFAAHCSLLFFSALLVAKLEGYWNISWWSVFLPVWVFHGIVARGRFSLPAPAPPHDRQWAPCHSVVAVPLLVSFELLLCCFLVTLEDSRLTAISLKVVFLPLLGFQAVILFDNFRMCRALMPGDEESMTDDAIWETLPHFWVAVSMVFFLAATMFTLLKLSGDVGALGWWDLFINFGIAECFAFLVCTRWSNPIMQRDSISHPGSVVPSTVSPLISISPLIQDASDSSSSSTVEESGGDSLCGRQEIGGHLLKVPILAFQVLLCMRLEGTPSRARQIPLIIVFAPLLLVQMIACFLALIRLIEQLWLLLRLSENHSNPLAIFLRFNDCCGFLYHGSRLLGWWSIDETSREEHARLLSGDSSSYNTFTGPTPEVVKKMARKDLAEEVWRLQAVLGEQSEITKHQQQEFDRLQNEKVLCRVCFERDITVVLLPCRHRILCSFCSEKCKHCPICRGSIAERMSVYDV